VQRERERDGRASLGEGMYWRVQGVVWARSSRAWHVVAWYWACNVWPLVCVFLLREGTSILGGVQGS
jgi:hypothetical protein